MTDIPNNIPESGESVEGPKLVIPVEFKLDAATEAQHLAEAKRQILADDGIVDQSATQGTGGVDLSAHVPRGTSEQRAVETQSQRPPDVQSVDGRVSATRLDATAPLPGGPSGQLEAMVRIMERFMQDWDDVREAIKRCADSLDRLSNAD